jgi:hypothetical protein
MRRERDDKTAHRTNRRRIDVSFKNLRFFAAPPGTNRRDSHWPAVKSPPKPRRLVMKRALIAMSAAGALMVGTMAAPQQAEAHAWWFWPAVIGGAVVAGSVIAGTHAQAYYGAPHGYYGGSYYAPRGTVTVAPTRNCTVQAYPALWGGYRYVESCR